jgi:hypothetical protein
LLISPKQDAFSPLAQLQCSKVLTTVYTWLILVFGEALKTTDPPAMLL